MISELVGIASSILLSVTSVSDEALEQVVDQPQNTVNIIMTGDILLHTPVEEAAVQSDGSINFDSIFANTRDIISGADLALVNQEVIIGGEDLGVSGYPAFNAPYEIGDALVDSGFDVILHATNHALDKGKNGILNCINFWETNYPDITYLGINDSSKQQDSIYFFQKGNKKIAVLNYTYGTNGIELPSDMPYAVNLLDEDKVRSDIQRAEAEGDFTIVCPHWGTEYNLGISDQQKKWTDIFYEEGVDLVIGTHPHVVEPVEIIHKEGNAHKMLVYYSLGNYVNWTSGTGDGVSDRMLGAIADVDLDISGNAVFADTGTGGSVISDEDIFIKSYGVDLIVSHVTSGTNGVTVYKLDDYTQELAGQNEIVSQDPDFSLEYLNALSQQVFGDLVNDK